MVAKPLRLLREKMSPAAQARAAEKADQMIGDMALDELRAASRSRDSTTRPPRGRVVRGKASGEAPGASFQAAMWSCSRSEFSDENGTTPSC